MREREINPEIAPETKIKKTFEIDNQEMKSYFGDKREELTEKYKNDEKFKDVLAAFEKNARENGFRGFVVKEGDFISVDINFIYDIDVLDDDDIVIENKVGIYEEELDKVNVGESVIENLNDLYEADRDFCEKGLGFFLSHEKQHTEGESGEMTKRMQKEIVDRIKLENAKDFNSVCKIRDEVLVRDYPLAEQKTEEQRMEATEYKDLDDFIESQANCYTALFFVYLGFEHFRENRFDINQLNNVPGFRVVKKEFCEGNDKKKILYRILDRMEEMRKRLIAIKDKKI